MSDTGAERGGQEPTVGERLLGLQRIDTELDQLGHRREHLPERDHHAAACAALAAWEAQRTALRERLAELEGEIESAEQRAADLGTDRERLEAQLKTVIAPREAEALMHEIETATARRDEVELAEIAALEEQSEVDDRLTAHLGEEEALRTATTAADEALAAAATEIDVRVAALQAQRAVDREAIGASVLSRYDRVRASQGVAAALLDGHRCQGCHLDLSAAEVDDVKDEAAAAGGIATCPNCGRILVV